MYTQFYMLFLLMGTGYLFRRLHLLHAEAHQSFYNLVVYLAFPAVILSKLMTLDLSGGALLQFLLMLAATTTMFGICSVCGKLFLRIRKYPAGATPAESVETESWKSMIYPNTGFLGFPVALAFYGSDGLFFMIAENVVMSAFLYSVCFNAFKAKTDADESRARRIWKATRQILLQPVVIASFLGLVLASLQIHLPELANHYINSLANLSASLCMIYTGSIFGGYRVKLTDTEVKALISTSFFKLLIFPAVAAVFGLLLISLGLFTPATATYLVVGTAMPTAALISAFADQTGHNARYVSCVVFITTVLSMATTPLWVNLCARLFPFA